MKREHKPEGPRIQHIELSDKNVRLRLILIGVLLVIAIAAIVWGILASRVKPGMYKIESASAGYHCGGDVSFYYELGAGEKKAHKENEELTELYSALTEKAWQLFYTEAEDSSVGNLCRVNSHPNEEVSVDPALYEAFRLLETCGSRLHYLGPVYEAYYPVINSDDPLLAADDDPGRNEELRQYVLELAQYAADPDAIRLELRPDNKVILHISEEYEAFCQENGEEVYVDFGWLRNAFVVDYLADNLEKNGFTNGCIEGVDGFVRNLYRNGGGNQLAITNRRENVTELVAAMACSKPTSLVYLQTHDSSGIYTFSDGRVVTYMVDIADGQCKAALPNLLGYSESASCAEIALKLAPTYIADSFSADGLKSLTAEGIYSVWFEGKTLHYNQQGLQLVPKTDDYIQTLTN